MHISKEEFRSTKRGYLVTADTRESNVISTQCLKLFVTYTEVATRRKLIFLCKTKADVRQHTITALNRIETHLRVRIKHFKPDGAKILIKRAPTFL